MPEPHGPSEHSPQTRRLKAYLRFVVLYCAVGFVIFQLPTFIPAFGPFARRPGYLTNTAVKMAALLLLSLLAASDPARFRHLTAIFALAYSTCVLTAAAVLIWVVEGGETFVLLGHTLPLGKSLAGVAVMEAAVILGLAWLARAADRAQLGLAYLSPAQFRALGAIADVVVRGRGESVPAEAIARNVDAYLAELKAPSKWLVKVVLLALGSGTPCSICSGCGHALPFRSWRPTSGSTSCAGASIARWSRAACRATCASSCRR
jgi:hypothetical protein